MSYLSRTIRNLRKIGFKEAGHQMQHIGDTKAGRLVGIDKMGNRYFEDNVSVIRCADRVSAHEGSD